MKRIIGIGNALTDVLVNLSDDEVIRRFGFTRGGMHLVDSQVQKSISEDLAELPHTLSMGGSAANTIRALAKLGCETGFVGKVGSDRTGDYYVRALENLRVRATILRGDSHSGRCVSLVSNDGERTMVTYLGAAVELTADELSPEVFDGFDCLYIEGFLVQDRDLIEGAVKMAKMCGLKIAIDLACANVVAQNYDFLRGLVEAHIDILFANEQEAEAFTHEKEPLAAIDHLSRFCDTVVVKVGPKGAYIWYDGEITHVGIMDEARRIDSTGAGDFYAAGFLYGLSQGMTIRQCGTIGAVTAGRVIEVVGTTFSEEVWDDITGLVKRVRAEQYLL